MLVYGGLNVCGFGVTSSFVLLCLDKRGRCCDFAKQLVQMLPYYSLPSKYDKSTPHPLTDPELQRNYFEKLQSLSLNDQLLPLRKLREAHIVTRSYDPEIWEYSVRVHIKTGDLRDLIQMITKMSHYDQIYDQYLMIATLKQHETQRRIREIRRPYTKAQNVVVMAREAIVGFCCDWNLFRRCLKEADEIQVVLLRVILWNVADGNLFLLFHV